MENRSERINDLVTALARAQQEIGKPVADKKNDFYGSQYATLSSVIDSTKGPLANHGLVVRQVTKMIDGVLMLITYLEHSSGQWVSSEIPIIADMANPQTVGKALTYMKRYSWASMLGVSAPEEDDDGEALRKSSQPKKTEFKTYKHQPTPPAQKATTHQVGLLTNKINGNKQLLEIILSYNKVRSLEELPFSAVEGIIKYINSLEGGEALHKSPQQKKTEFKTHKPQPTPLAQKATPHQVSLLTNKINGDKQVLETILSHNKVRSLEELPFSAVEGIVKYLNSVKGN